eukprot:UN20472
MSAFCCTKNHVKVFRSRKNWFLR